MPAPGYDRRMTEADDAFDDGAYLATNPDLAAAFAGGRIGTGQAHWQDTGRAETRSGHRPSLLDAAAAPGSPRPTLDAAATEAALAGLGTFDAAAYVAMNPDLAATLGGDLEAARRHWVAHGRLEGRIGPGDAPYRDRAVALGRLLALPFGVDLHVPALETGIEGQAARQLLAALRAAGIPVSIRPYDDRAEIPRLTAAAAARDPGHRVSLFVASPLALRALHRMLAPAVFEASYVVAFVPRLALGAHMPDYPLFGMLDELWTASDTQARLLAAVAPLPVRHIALPPRTLAPRAEARRLLGLPQAGYVLALDATAAAPGPGAPQLDRAVGNAIERFLSRAGGDRGLLLLVRAGAATASLVARALHGVPHATFRCDPTCPGEGSLVFAAANAVLRSDAIAHEIAGHGARLTPVAPAALAACLDGRHDTGPAAPAVSAAEAGARILAILGDLGLAMPQPRFAATIGRSRDAMWPPMPSPAPDVALLPVLSLLLPGAGLDRPMLDRIAAALTAQPHPFWELCVDRPDGAALRDRHDAGAHDPRLRLVAGDQAARRAAATGDHVLPVASAAAALRRAGQLTAIAGLIARENPDLVVRADPAASATDFIDTIEAGGPAATPIAIRRDRAEGGAGDLAALVLRLVRTGARIAALADSDTDTAPPHPAAEEAGRRTRLRHARELLGPAAWIEAGLAPATWRIRRRFPTGVAACVRRLDGAAALPAGALRQAVREAAAEHVVLLWGGAAPEGRAVAALAELLLDDGIGAAGGCVLHADGTVADAGQVLDPHGRLRAPGQGAPPELGGEAGAVLRVRNVDAVGGGALAVRRSALFGLRPVARDVASADTPGPAEAPGSAEAPRLAEALTSAEAQAVALCRALREEAGLRIVATPFARFRRPD